MSQSPARSFGSVADLYDRARPSYPDSLVDDLMAGGPRRVLDIGCGTGIASRLFLQRGCEVVGVEHDARMAEVARGAGVKVDVATFESWSPPAEPFDLVVSGQAWHWIDQGVGPGIVAGVLRPGGRFGAFWNIYRHIDTFGEALLDAYGEHAPQLGMAGSLALGTSRERPEQRSALEADHRFASVEMRYYPWSVTYTSREWTDQLSTHSDHIALAADVRHRLILAVRRLIDDAGGTITVHHDAQLLTAIRRDT